MYVLSGVVDDPQQRKHGRDLRGRKRALARVCKGRNAPPRELRRIKAEPRTAAQQHADITVAAPPRAAALFAHGKAFLHQALHRIRHRARVSHGGVAAAHVHNIQLHGAAVVSVVRASHQHFVPVVVHVAHCAAHHTGKHIIDLVDDIARAAEVVAQGDGGRVRAAGRIRRKTAALADEYLRAGQTEAVNALLHVAHKKQVGAVVVGEALIQKRLQGIGILIFVHKHRVEPAGHRAGHSRFFAVFTAQQLQCQMLKIAVLQCLFRQLIFVQPRPEGLCSTGQSRSHRRNAGTVFFKFGLRAQEYIFFQTLRSVLGGGAQRLHRIHSRALISAHSLERRRLVFGCINSRTVPPARADVFQQRREKRRVAVQRRCIIGKLRLLRDDALRRIQQAQCAARGPPGVFQQCTAPCRLAQRLSAFVGCADALQRRCGMGQRAGKIIQPQHRGSGAGVAAGAAVQ